VTSAVIENLASGELSTGGVTTIAPQQVPGASLAAGSSALPGPLDFEGTIADARPTALPFIAGSTRTFGEATIAFAYDARFMNPGGPMILDPIPGNPIGPNLTRGALAANADDNETDESLSGPVPSTETDTGLLTWMSLSQASGRSSGRGSSPIFAEPALQASSTGELANSSGLSYLAAAGSATVLAELSASRDDVVLLADEDQTESGTTSPIVDAGTPLSILLSGSDVPIPTEQGGVEQVTELIPLSESSLALAATLWTLRSGSQASAPGLDRPAGAATDPVVSFPSPMHWAVFMTGIDRAFEQTFRDVQVDNSVGDGRHKKGEESQRGLDDRLQWQGSILPGAAEGPRGGKEQVNRPGQFSAEDESGGSDARTQRPAAGARLSQHGQPRETSPILNVAEPQDDKGQPVVLASTPVVWVVSVSSIVAGWLWGKKRERRQRFRREEGGECGRPRAST
jgi:hypothetical protein